MIEAIVVLPSKDIIMGQSFLEVKEHSVVHFNDRLLEDPLSHDHGQDKKEKKRQFTIHRTV